MLNAWSVFQLPDLRLKLLQSNHHVNEFCSFIINVLFEFWMKMRMIWFWILDSTNWYYYFAFNIRTLKWWWKYIFSNWLGQTNLINWINWMIFIENKMKPFNWNQLAPNRTNVILPQKIKNNMPSHHKVKIKLIRLPLIFSIPALFLSIRSTSINCYFEMLINEMCVDPALK